MLMCVEEKRCVTWKVGGGSAAFRVEVLFASCGEELSLAGEVK
jgi:hypothetical protein